MVWPTWNSCVVSAGLWGCVLLLTSLSAFCASPDAQTLINKCKGSDVGHCKAYSSILQCVKNIVKDTKEFTGPIKEITSEGMKGLVIKYNKHSFTDIQLALPSLGDTNKDTDTIKVTISNEALQKAIGRNESMQVGIIMFNKSIFPDAQNSSLLLDEVIAIELGTPISDLTDNITITFYHEYTLEDRKCVFWDVISNGSNAIWNESGCQTVCGTNQTVCSCNHLTFFAVLMSPNNITLSNISLKALTYITYIGCGVSLFSLGVTLFMYIMLRKSDHSTTIHQSLCSALFLLNLAFLLNEWLTSYNIHGLCQLIAALMHYSLLCTFTWFGIEAFHLYLLMIKVFNTYIKHYRKKLSLVGWGIPAIAVIVCSSLKKYGNYTIYTEKGSVSMCWLTDPAVRYVTIACYALVFLWSMVIFSVVTLKIVQLGKSGSSHLEKGSTRRNVCTLLGLCCLLGLTWGIIFFNFGALEEPALYTFTILNSLHGFFVFLRYYALSKARSSEAKISTSTD
ncbi:adhesion G-protein coupled receptor G2-like isoform X2 [Polyodon spathula]|nr:adhesion G-protein coupled receptor G2-like isoform X2 [Polyodon spathula]